MIWGPHDELPASPRATDDGFGSQSLIVDLDQDGCKDVLIADVDVDDPTGYGTGAACPGCGPPTAGCTSTTTSANAPNVTLQEEQQQSGSSGWKGVVGTAVADLRGTHNVAALDIDRDGDKDLVLGRTCTHRGVDEHVEPLPHDRVRPDDEQLDRRAGDHLGDGRAGGQRQQPAADASPACRRARSGIFFASPIKTDPCVPASDGLRCAGRRGDRYLQIGGNVTANASGRRDRLA